MNKAETTLDKIKIALGLKSEEVKMASMKLEDGVTIIEAEMFEAGQPVMIVTEDDQRIALPEGEYVLEDGMVLKVVEEGVIDSIGEKVEEEPIVEDEVAASDSAEQTVATPKKVIEAVTKESHFSKEMPDSVLKAIADVVDAKLAEYKAELSKEEVELSKEAEELELEAIKPITPNPEKANKVEFNKQNSSLTSYLNNLTK